MSVLVRVWLFGQYFARQLALGTTSQGNCQLSSYSETNKKRMAESNQKESNSKTQQQKTKKAIALLTQFCKYLSLHFMKTISTKFDNKCSLNSNTIFFSCPLTCSYNPNPMSLLLACYFCLPCLVCKNRMFAFSPKATFTCG